MIKMTRKERRYERFLKRVKARTTHVCTRCGAEILPPDIYFQETTGRFLASLHARAFCKKCYEDMGDNLLSWKQEQTDRDKDKLDRFIK
jgi:ribosomal protein L32